MARASLSRRQLLAAGFAGLVVPSWPLFLLLDHAQTVPILLGQCGFAALVAAFSGALPAALVEMHPQRIRCSAMSFAYNASIGLAGGTTPMVAVYLMATVSSIVVGAEYLHYAFGTDKLLPSVQEVGPWGAGGDHINRRKGMTLGKEMFMNHSTATGTSRRRRSSTCSSANCARSLPMPRVARTTSRR